MTPSSFASTPESSTSAGSRSPASIPAMMAPVPAKQNPLTRSLAGMIGMGVLGVIVLMCLLTLPWTFGTVDGRAGATAAVRYDAQVRTARQLPPFWAPSGMLPRETSQDTAADRLAATARALAIEAIQSADPKASPPEPTPAQIAEASPKYWMGTDLLGRSVLIRCLAGGGISLAIGISAATIAVFLGTLYGALAGAAGGRIDAVMMRVVDVLFGLPSILLIVLLGVAVDASIDRWQVASADAVRTDRTAWVNSQWAALSPKLKEANDARQALEVEAIVRFGTGELAPWLEQTVGIVTLFVAIGGVSWLTMARVVRGQVLSLKAQPFMEAARAMGVGVRGQFFRHLLPNLMGPIIVYATLTVPQAILQESFLSFLGIGVRPPVPSWGNLAADGLVELNAVKSNWWLLLFPCMFLAVTLLALNFVGEGLREAMDPKRTRR